MVQGIAERIEQTDERIRDQLAERGEDEDGIEGEGDAGEEGHVRDVATDEREEDGVGTRGLPLRAGVVEEEERFVEETEGHCCDNGEGVREWVVSLRFGGGFEIWRRLL